MNDTIEVRGLRVIATHGALAEEKVRAQPFEVDLDVETSFAQPGTSDELSDAVHYGVLIEEVTRVITSSHYALLEALAEAVATSILGDERIDAVTVGLRKLRPPVALDVSTVGVRITRRRTDISGG